MKIKKKLPVVSYKTVITINGKDYVQTSMSYSESVGQAIGDGWLKNTKQDIIDYILHDDN